MKEQTRQPHTERWTLKRTELNDTKLTNISQNRSLKKYPSLIKTLRVRLENRSTSKQNSQVTERAFRSNRPNIQSNISYRILNEILNSPEMLNRTSMDATMNYASVQPRQHPEPFDCSSVKRHMNVVEEEEQLFGRVHDERMMMEIEDRLSQKIQRMERITRLDELEFALESISSSFDEYYGTWFNMHQLSLQILQNQNQCQSVTSFIRQIDNKIYQLKEELYNTSRQFITNGQNTLIQDSKTQTVNRIAELHQELNNKLGHKNTFCQALIFNIKVLLPTHIQAPTLFVLYTKLFQSKLCKKLQPLMKKELVNLSHRDSKLAQDFLKHLLQNECNYSNKTVSSAASLQSQSFHLKISNIVQQVQSKNVKKSQLQAQLTEQKEKQQALRNEVGNLKKKIDKTVMVAAKNLSLQYRQATNEHKDFNGLLSIKIENQQKRTLSLLMQRHRLQRSLQNGNMSSLNFV